VQSHLTDYEWHELLTPGSPLYLRWCAQVDVVAGYLRQLRDAHVPVLFRAYHEINGNWFWWTGRPGKDGSAALYRMIYDRFVNVHHLDNLVWVWNANAPGGNAGPIEEYFPGSQFADLVTMDVYGEFKQEYYDSMIALAAGKPIALAEVGTLPAPDVLDRQLRWTYFMVWSEWIHSANPLELANAVYHAPRMLNRDDLRLAGSLEAIRKATAERTHGALTAEPVTPGATAEAMALLTRLTTGNSVLSGQENDPAAPSAATDAVIQATGKQPAIYAADLGGSPEARQAVVQEALKAHKNHAEVSLSWRPARPTDNAPASAKGQLTDFEWNELLTPGTTLNRRWSAQVDEVAGNLRELEKAGIVVLWIPYPESNGKDFWWAGRKGIHGSSELYRQLFDRLVNRDGLRNLLWVWQAAQPEFGPGSAGAFSDYFPGLLYADALAVSLRETNPRSRSANSLAQFGVGKVIGVELTGDLPSPEFFAQNPSWAWFLAAPTSLAPADSTARTEALRNLYGDPHIASLPAAK
jgi:beta-mannanase